MKKVLGVVCAIVAALLGLAVLVGVVGVVLLQSGALNGVIEDAIAAGAGQPARLEQAPSLGLENGALTLRVGPLSVANAAWAAQQHADLAHIEEIRTSLRLLPLLSGRIELPGLTVEGPQLHLARAEDGRTNWPEGDHSGSGPAWLPEVRHLAIRNAELTYTDAALGTDVRLALDEATRHVGDQDFTLQASGALHGGPSEGGAATRFEAKAKVAPGENGSTVTADVTTDGASVHVDGKVADLAVPLAGFEGTFALDAPQLGQLLARYDVPFADEIPSADVDGSIAHDGQQTTVAVQGSIGGDTIKLQGGYEGAVTALLNPHVEIHLEGSALGAVPAQLGFATRPIESYRIDATLEERADGPSPIKLNATVENTNVSFDGGIDELRALKGVEGSVHATGPDPAAVLDLFKLPSISLPPYDMAGQVTWRGDDMKVTGLDGKLGDSDIRGDIAVDLRPEPPGVTADLQSDLLDLDDLGGLIGAPPATGPGETASPAQEQRAERREEEGRLLPAKEIDPDLWRKLDLDVKYNVDRIESAYLPIDRIRVHATSSGGWLKVDPLVTGLADGTIVGFASLDATQAPMASEFDVRIEALQLQDMLAKLGASGEGLGTIDGRVRLEGRGTSAREVLGSADGQIVLIMTGGGLDALIIEAVGLDIAESLAVLVNSFAQSEEDKVPIRCAIVNLQIEQGVATAQPIVIDTTDSKITVDGKINLKDETLDLFIQAYPKDPSLFSGNQPIHVDGQFLSPSVNPAPGRTENEALGWLLAPLAAVLPFFDVGGEQDAPCDAMLAEAKQAAADRPQ